MRKMALFFALAHSRCRCTRASRARLAHMTAANPATLVILAVDAGLPARLLAQLTRAVGRAARAKGVHASAITDSDLRPRLHHSGRRQLAGGGGLFFRPTSRS